MEPNDDFPRRLLAAARAFGVDPAATGRHLPIMQRCVPADDPIRLLARVDRSADRACYLLLLTARRLVVTGESLVLRRRRLHLNAEPRQLLDVLWTPEPTLGGLALAATAVDGVREHFWVRTGDPHGVAETLTEAFRMVPVPV